MAKIRSNISTTRQYVIRLHSNEYYSIVITDLGLYTDCNGMNSHELKPVDFDFPEGQIQRLHGKNRFPDQYFIACVPHVTEDDILLYREAKEKYGRLVSLVRTFYCSLMFDIHNSIPRFTTSSISPYPNIYIHSTGWKWTSGSSGSGLSWCNGV